jgi:hypothetical protein
MTVKYGQIAGNTSINAMIYHCFEYICKEDQRQFVKKFQEQPHDSNQINHTFRELVLGGYLSSKGFRIIHDYVIDNQTPDWSILDVEGQSITGIVELTNFHIDKASESDIKEQLRARGRAFYWLHQNKDNDERLYHSLWRKASAYKSIIEKLQIPYVVGVIGEFEVAIDFEEVCLCLFDEKTGLFGVYPQLSGVLYFEHNLGEYSFKYSSNPDALHKIELPVGIFPSAAA